MGINSCYPMSFCHSITESMEFTCLKHCINVTWCVCEIYSTCLHCHPEFFPATVLRQCAEDQTPEPSGAERDYSSALHASDSSYTAQHLNLTREHNTVYFFFLQICSFLFLLSFCCSVFDHVIDLNMLKRENNTIEQLYINHPDMHLLLGKGKKQHHNKACCPFSYQEFSNVPHKHAYLPICSFSNGSSISFRLASRRISVQIYKRHKTC